MIVPLPVLFTFVLVFAIISALYYLAILKPEQDEQCALRRRLKTDVGAVKGAVDGPPARGVAAQRDSRRQPGPRV